MKSCYLHSSMVMQTKLSSQTYGFKCTCLGACNGHYGYLLEQGLPLESMHFSLRLTSLSIPATWAAHMLTKITRRAEQPIILHRTRQINPNEFLTCWFLSSPFIIYVVLIYPGGRKLWSYIHIILSQKSYWIQYTKYHRVNLMLLS